MYLGAWWWAVPYLQILRQISRTERDESNRRKTPAGFNINVVWFRTRACARGTATRSSLPPENLIVPESHARPSKNKSHAMPLSSTGRRSHSHGERLIFLRRRQWPLACLHQRRDSLEVLRNSPRALNVPHRTVYAGGGAH